MKLIQAFVVLLTTMLFSDSILAAVYKCTDSEGNTSYKSTPCPEENDAAKVNVKTGNVTDLSIKLREKELDLELKKQQELEQQKLIVIKAQRKKDAEEQSALNQQLIKNNPKQFSAFAIPPYVTDKLPPLVKEYETRLPEIEKFRRLAAQKALATGECNRVETNTLSNKSKTDALVISIDCSSAKTFHFSESELTE